LTQKSTKGNKKVSLHLEKRGREMNNGRNVPTTQVAEGGGRGVRERIKKIILCREGHGKRV